MVHYNSRIASAVGPYGQPRENGEDEIDVNKMEAPRIPNLPAFSLIPSHPTPSAHRRISVGDMRSNIMRSYTSSLTYLHIGGFRPLYAPG